MFKISTSPGCEVSTVKNTKCLLGVSCLISVAVASQRAKGGFQWPADFKEHFPKIAGNYTADWLVG